MNALVREASTAALKEFMINRDKEEDLPPVSTFGPPSAVAPVHGVGLVCVQLKHIEVAFQKVKPSVSERVSVVFFIVFSLFITNFIKVKALSHHRKFQADGVLLVCLRTA